MSGQTIVLVEQNLAATLELAERIYIINTGHIVHEGPAAEIMANREILQRYLGVQTRAAAKAAGDRSRSARGRFAVTRQTR